MLGEIIISLQLFIELGLWVHILRNFETLSWLRDSTRVQVGSSERLKEAAKLGF